MAIRTNEIVTMLLLGIFFMVQLVLHLVNVRARRRNKEALAATIADSEAGELFVWIAEHEGTPLTHPECQELLRRKIETYREFLRTHPSLGQKKEFNDHLARLENLLAE